MKFYNKKLKAKLWKKAQNSEDFFLFSGPDFWLGFETSAEYFYLQEIRKLKYIKKIK